MEVSGQLYGLAALLSGKDFGTHDKAHRIEITRK
jgi:hypothetical protein